MKTYMIIKAQTGIRAAALVAAAFSAVFIISAANRPVGGAEVSGSDRLAVSGSTVSSSGGVDEPGNASDELVIDGVSLTDDDIRQAIPANVRLDRISVAVDVTPPLESAWVSSLFGLRTNPVSGKYTFHTGLDLAAPGGAEIHAMYSGRVKTASFDSGYGNYVVLEHSDGLETLYAHCSKLKCAAGDSVNAGDVIALVGSTGNSTGNHLHVEFRRDGQRFDPEWILGGIYS